MLGWLKPLDPCVLLCAVVRSEGIAPCVVANITGIVTGDASLLDGEIVQECNVIFTDQRTKLCRQVDGDLERR